ncbi:hypothetical protein LXA43DRAFT_1090689 [Ganoderma leucocontextum]|nr:hypothetical protein LXA43DRAFT_1090689 [Ganoderma leucocontextum]
MTNSFLSLLHSFCLLSLALYFALLVTFDSSLLVFGHPMEATVQPPDGASVLVGHTVGDVFVVDETMSTTTPVLLGVLMMVVFLGISGFLITKAIQTHAQLANSLPIPVSRLAGADTIEDIFKLGKRSTDKRDINPEPSAPPRGQTQKLDDVPLATPHRHSGTNLHFRKPQISSMDSMDLLTPLLVPSSASPSTGRPCTPDSTLDTPPAPIPTSLALFDTLTVHKPRRALDVLVNRSPSTSGFADLEVDNERYLRAALGLSYPDGWGGFGYWSEASKDVAYGGDGPQDAWYMGENEFHGWAFPGPGGSREFDKTA